VKRQAEVEALIAPAFRPLIKGETDSERCFYACLTELGAGADAERPVGAEAVARALATTLTRLAQIADRPELDPSSMNFLLTDGRVMVATRRHRTLFVAQRPGQVLISSEKVTPEDDWREVPEMHVVGVEPDLTVRRWSVAELAAAGSALTG
jgi:hypothetical protein